MEGIVGNASSIVENLHSIRFEMGEIVSYLEDSMERICRISPLHYARWYISIAKMEGIDYIDSNFMHEGYSVRPLLEEYVKRDRKRFLEVMESLKSDNPEKWEELRKESVELFKNSTTL